MTRRKKRRRPNLGKGIYILPNLFTTASLFFGFYSILSTLEGHYMAAAVAIIISSVCDGLDGKIARMTKTTSQFGVEYDSLADLVAFGVAPGILCYIWALKPFGRLGWVAAFLFVACGALRLARFNVMAPNQKDYYFQGLPIPMAAVMISFTVFFFNYLGHTGPIKHGAVLLFIFALSFLMVSNFRYFSLKDPDLLRSKPFNTLVIAILILALVAVQPKVVLFLMGMVYVASGPVLTIYKIRELRRERTLTEEADGETPEPPPTTREE